MPAFLGSLLAKAAVVVVEALVAHLVQLLIQNYLRSRNLNAALA
ncbi:hypothetical protein HNP84_008645 [Thermocatellispora tengchongensis]|uniref:Uncharacterized protein n=1 Tax=Thermocatellispora tengchongensis TaxID=1073253 RepID=A0A840PLM5_9ACTN|nr:hypothetical protein [Thermocatellispora tengchongensis]MBB5138883.1 hypothetical protein [Thermocatellispora tengchongensis]